MRIHVHAVQVYVYYAVQVCVILAFSYILSTVASSIYFMAPMYIAVVIIYDNM